MKTISALNIRTALQSAPPVLDFVLPGLPAGSVGTIVGAGGIGKTTILMQLAAALATGSAAFDGLGPANGTPARVVLVAAEESADILRIRLHAIKKWLDLKPGEPVRSADANCLDLTTLLEKNLRLVPAAGQPVALVKDGAPTPFFETLGEFCSNARLIIIDPLRRLHDGDENSSSVMTTIVQVLEALATKTGAAIIVAHHIGKASMFNAVTDSAAASRGSSALTDAVRWQLNLSGMSELEAKAHRVSGQHKSYLRIDFAKANYMPPEPTLWFKRLDGGVLARATLASASASTGYAEQAGDIAGANTKKRRNYEW